MSPAESRWYAVDRLEGRIAVLVGDDGTTRDVPQERLPTGARAGSVLAVPLAGGEPDWSRASLDEAERTRREREARRLLDELRKRDPGGDVTL